VSTLLDALGDHIIITTRGRCTVVPTHAYGFKFMLFFGNHSLTFAWMIEFTFVSVCFLPMLVLVLFFDNKFYVKNRPPWHSFILNRRWNSRFVFAAFGDIFLSWFSCLLLGMLKRWLMQKFCQQRRSLYITNFYFFVFIIIFCPTFDQPVE